MAKVHASERGFRIEKDCTAWAHERLKEELPLVQINGDSSMAVLAVKNISGDVSVNVRKGRIRQIFDLTFELLCKDDQGEFGATITDFMSDTDYAGMELSASSRPKERREVLKAALWQQLEAFKREVEEVHGKSLLVQTASAEATSQPRQKFTGIFEDKEDRGAKGLAALDEQVTFCVPLELLWSALTDPAQIMMWTRGTARMTSFEPGSSFTLFNGNVLGTVTAVVDRKAIKMDWRLKHWPSECVSQVSLSLSQDSAGHASLHLKQTGIPAAEVDSIRENWSRYYWEPIKTVLGCSSAIAF